MGATLHYETPPFTQGTIEAIAADGASYVIRIDKGYPADLADRRYFPSRPTGYLFDRVTRWWKPGTYDLEAIRVESLGPGLFRFRPFGPDVHPVTVGDLIAFRESGDQNITVVHSTEMHIDGVTVNNAGSFAVWEDGGAGRTPTPSQLNGIQGRRERRPTRFSPQRQMPFIAPTFESVQ